MVIGSCCDESALDSDCCNIITGSSRCVNFQPQDPTKGRRFTYLEDPGTRFTRVLGFCVIFIFSWTVVRSSRLLIPIGCPSIVTFKRNSDFEKHRWHRCLLFAGAVGMSFCDAHDSLLFRVDPIQQIFNVQRRGVCEDKDMPCESDEAGEKCSDALQRWLHEGSLCSLPLYVASFLQDCHSQVDGKCWAEWISPSSQLLDLHFFRGHPLHPFQVLRERFLHRTFLVSGGGDGWIYQLAVRWLSVFVSF